MMCVSPKFSTQNQNLEKKRHGFEDQRAMVTTSYFCIWMIHQSCSKIQNLVVIHHLVFSYPHRCHIGIDVDH